MSDQEEIVDRRREIVRHWFMMGAAVPTILDHLARHDEYSFLDPTLRYKGKCKVIEEDISAIKARMMKNFDASAIDSQQAHTIYLARSEYHYTLALQAGNVPLAQAINKDIARAQGVETEEKISAGGDIFSLLSQATRKAREISDVDKNSLSIEIQPSEIKQLSDESTASPPPFSVVAGKKEGGESQPMSAFAILKKTPSS